MLRTRFRSMGLILATVLSLGAGAPIWAQDDGGAAAQPAAGDDLQHAVARISVMEGQVSVRRGDADWVAGVINAPLLADDHVSTGPNSRAEVQFDAANLLRLGGTAEIRISALEAGRLQLELSHGTVTYRVLRPSATTAEVDTPNISVKPTRIGVYRISVTDSGETELTVRAGDLEVFSPRGSQWVNAGQTMVARGSTADPEFQIVAAAAPDGWDAWSDSRDRLLLESRSVQRVPQGVYGSEDLDNHGDWVYDADYGNVWQPRVDPGWAPYQLGQWENLDWYGWTWVSADPWGWAPYHYGRWFHRGGYGWRWYPGVFGVPHYWSPALVGFFGFGGGVGFGAGFGFGNIGWVPLAPYEVCHPWWGRGYNRGGYGNRFGNIGGVNIRNAYRNARVPNGVTGLSVHDFQNRGGSGIVRPTAAQFASAGMIRGAVPLAAGGAANRFSGRAASYAPRNSGRSTTFFRAPQTASGAGGRFNSPRAANAGNSTGWSRFGTPGGGGRPALQGARPSSPAGGYQRFGESGSGYRGNPYSGNGGPRYGAPGQRSGAPTYSTPHYGGSGGPSYNSPRSGGGGGGYTRGSAPSYNPPRYSGGGGGYGGGGGGGGHNSGGASGGHSSSGGGGGGGHSSGSGSGHSGGGGTSRR